MLSGSTRCSAIGIPTGRPSNADRPRENLGDVRRASCRCRRGRRRYHRRRLCPAVGTPGAPGVVLIDQQAPGMGILWQCRPPGDRTGVSHRRPVDPQTPAPPCCWTPWARCAWIGNTCPAPRYIRDESGRVLYDSGCRFARDVQNGINAVGADKMTPIDQLEPSKYIHKES